MFAFEKLLAAYRDEENAKLAKIQSECDYLISQGWTFVADHIENEIVWDHPIHNPYKVKHNRDMAMSTSRVTDLEWSAYNKGRYSAKG